MRLCACKTPDQCRHYKSCKVTAYAQAARDVLETHKIIEPFFEAMGIAPLPKNEIKRLERSASLRLRLVKR